MNEIVVEKQVNVLNESLIIVFKIGPTWTNSFLTCQICNSMEHVATMCSTIGDFKPKCGNYGLLHTIENWGVRCGYCLRMGHTKNKCWKRGKDVKTPMKNYYLEVMVDDEVTTLKQLNNLCGIKHHIFWNSDALEKIMNRNASTWNKCSLSWPYVF